MQTDQINSEANDQTTTYGRFNSNPTPEQLEAYFTLTENDLLLVQRSRYDHTRLGVAVQLCTLKFFNTFLPDPSDVPEVVVGYLAEQLGISSFDLSKYVVTDDSKLRHRERIRDYLEYREFNDAARFGVARLLLSRLAIADEHPNVLFDTVTAWLVEHRIELPGATTLERFVTRIREHVSVALHRRLAARLSKAQTRRLEDLLNVPKDDTRTLFDRLRTEPSNLSSIGLGKAFERIRAIREVGVRSVNLEDVAENRLAPLVRSGLSVWASTLANYSVSRRLATLLALVQHLERTSTDDALVVFDSVMRDLDLKGRKRRQQERLRNLKDLDAAALTLRDAARVILDSSIPASKVRSTILQQLGETQLFEAIAKVSDLASPAEDEEAEVWERAHGSLAQFVRPMLETLEFDGSPSAKPILGVIS